MGLMCCLIANRPCIASRRASPHGLASPVGMATCTIRLRPTLRLFFENKHAYFPPAGYRRVHSLGPDLSDAMGARARAGLLALRMDKIRSRRFLVSHADGLDRPDVSTFSFHLGGPPGLSARLYPSVAQ